jgi:hypothetical protein
MSALPDPTLEPTMSVERAGALLGLGRSSAYEAARQFLDSDGVVGLPVLRFNARTLRCPTAKVLELLGLDATNGAHNGDAHAASSGDGTVDRE